jgi:hypothetical protein
MAFVLEGLGAAEKCKAGANLRNLHAGRMSRDGLAVLQFAP